MKSLQLLPLLLLPLQAAAAPTPAGEPIDAMALVERDGAWHLTPTQLQFYVDELGALVDIRSTVADATVNLVDTRLRAGTVTSLPLGTNSTCYNDTHEPKVFVHTLLQSDDHVLECQGDAQGQYHLRLSNGGRRQTLLGEEPPNGSWQLVWAGDLDRDGQPDLISEYSVEGGYCQQVLLSASAAPGQLVDAGEPYCLTD